MPTPQFSYFNRLVCSACAREFDSAQVQTFCPDCRAPLVSEYDLEQVKSAVSRAEISARPRGMWRWHELLPVFDPAHIVTLGESGLRVPRSFADRLILQTLRESQGTALAVSDVEIGAAQARLARAEGIFAAPEGAATLAGLEKLLASSWIRPDERVVLLNTATGLKYPS